MKSILFFHFAVFLRSPFQTTQSCDQRGFSIYCFPLIRGSSKNWGQSEFSPGPGLSFKEGKGDSDMGVSSQRPSLCSERLQNRIRRGRGQGTAPGYGRGLPEEHPALAAEPSCPLSGHSPPGATGTLLQVCSHLNLPHSCSSVTFSKV